MWERAMRATARYSRALGCTARRPESPESPESPEPNPINTSL